MGFPYIVEMIFYTRLDSKKAQLYLESQESIATDRQSRSHVIVLWPRRVWWHPGLMEIKTIGTIDLGDI